MAATRHPSSALGRLRALAAAPPAAAGPPRPVALLALACLALAALSLLGPVDPDLRPVGVDHLGPRDHAPRPRHDRRAVVEAAADPVHRAVLARRRRAGARAVDPGRPRRRPAGGRDGVPARGPARRSRGGRDRRRRAGARGRVRAQLRARQLRGPARRLLPAGGRAPPRRPPPRRVPARLPRRPAAARGVAAVGPLRPLAPRRRLARPAAVARARARGRRRPGDADRVVRAGVPRLGLAAARRRARAPAQPRLRRLRGVAVPGGVPPLGLDPVRAGLRAAP